MISYNGLLYPASHAFFSLEDRGLLFGDGVFTTILVSDGIAKNLEKHFERLKRDSLALNINIPYFEKSWIESLIDANEAKQGNWRLKVLVTAGNAKGIRLPSREAQGFFMSLEPVEKKEVNPCHLSLYPEPVVTPIARIKTLASLGRFFIKEFALQKGSFDALTSDCNGYILEASHSNIFWIKDNTLYTPSFDLPLLKGTFLEVLMENMQKKGMSIALVRARLKEIPLEAHVFICNAIMGVQPVDFIEGQQFLRNEGLVLG